MKRRVKSLFLLTNHTMISIARSRTLVTTNSLLNAKMKTTTTCNQLASTTTTNNNRTWSRRSVCGLKLGVLMLGSVTAPFAAQASTRSPIEQVLDNPDWPGEFPFRTQDFTRYDESDDSSFYQAPRFVTHIDDPAINALTNYYQEVFPKSSDACYLDLCSSWISHYPKNLKAKRISGLGMNAQELARNSILTDFEVKDLNKDPSLPYEDNTFDVVTNAVSVDYLNKPLQIFKEMHRVLKPGGLAIMSFSNRCFPTKVIQIWAQSSDAEHVYIVGSYFHYSVGAGGFEQPKCADITPKAGFFGRTDPMYVVYSRKQTKEG